MSPGAEIQWISVFTAAGCALPGAFLLLRRMSMMSDAITHTILLGIVLGFFLTQDLSSPLLLAGAAFIGVVTVWLTEAVAGTGLVSEDSAIGLVFPLLFSAAIILITRYAGSVHLDTDSVLLGELAFAPFERLTVWGVDIGAKAIYTSGAVLLVNLLFILLFFKELKLASFDPVLSVVLGFSPALFHYGLMGLVSLTTVSSFEAVGSVLVVAFMIAPPAAAYLLTDDLKQMLAGSVFFAVLSALLGYHAAIHFDVSIAGSMAVAAGAVFFAVFLCAPKRGLLADLLRRRRERACFAENAFLLRLLPGDSEAATMVQTDKKLCEKLCRKALVEVRQRELFLTEKGERQARAAAKKWFPV